MPEGKWQNRFGEILEAIVQQIQAEVDVECLDRWLDQVLEATSSPDMNFASASQNLR